VGTKGVNYFDGDILRQEILSLVERYAEKHTRSGPFVAGQTYVPPSGKLIDAAEIKLMTEAALAMVELIAPFASAEPTISGNV
jgi:hypothetical protein